MPGPPERAHVLTVSVEDYFHAGSFQGAVHRKHWERLDPRLLESMEQVLDLLRRFSQHATFFVMGCTADEHPGLVRRIIAEGHEVASSSYWPRSLSGMMQVEFCEDVARTRAAFARAGLADIYGYRASRDWLTRDDLWVLDTLAGLGFRYDSSLNPILRRFPGERECYRPHTHATPSEGSIEEFPVATVGLAGLRFAVSGGNWIRQFPHAILKRAIRIQEQRSELPLVFYFMPWEMDRLQPHLANLPALTKVRHYRNLAKTRWVFEDYFDRYRFQSISQYLGLPPQEVAPTPIHADAPCPSSCSAHPAHAGEAVTLVVPLFNEEQNVGYLHRTLLSLRERLAGRYDLRLVLVDDASTDNTWCELSAKFGTVPDVELIRQSRNVGAAKAILVGVRHATTEIVCSIDCDCSYDPSDLAAMIPLLGDADLVTASPYHPDGHVINVPFWRLFLSRTLSRMYSIVLRDRLHTFTSCCRVYRKSAVENIRLRHGGFFGIAETLINLKLRGGRIVEYPATLESRILGESKMKILRTIRGHLGIFADLIFGRRSTGDET